MKHGEILSIGGAYIDINVPDFPLGPSGLQLETEVVGGDYQLELGGSAVNFARLSSKLGVPAAFLGKIGQDEIGGAFKILLAEAGIRPLLVENGSVSSNIGFNMVASSGKSIMTVAGTANQSLTAEEVYENASEHLAELSYVYIGGCFKLKKLMPAFVQLAQDANNADVKIILDHGRVNQDATEQEQDIVRQLALLADYYLPSADEFLRLWNVQSIEEGLRKIAPQKQGFTVVKNSDQGAVTLLNEKLVTVPAFAVKPIHTIGAGDSFNAGFIAALHNNYSPQDSVQFGCATAALKISRAKLPSFDEVANLVTTLQ